MGMTYQSFKDFLINHLWKNGDQVVIDSLDNLVKLADAELNASFKVEARNKVMETEAISGRIQMPLDFRSMVSLSSPRYGGKTYTTQRDFANRHIEAHSRTDGYYTVSDGGIWLTGNITADAPYPLVMTYYANLPDFKATDASWMADDFFNVYLYCVLKHSAPLLREDERVPMWQAMFREAFDNAMDENAHEVKYAGTPLKIRMRGVR